MHIGAVKRIRFIRDYLIYVDRKNLIEDFCFQMFYQLKITTSFVILNVTPYIFLYFYTCQIKKNGNNARGLKYTVLTLLAIY